MPAEDRETFYQIMRYAAANENVDEEWVMGGVARLLNVSMFDAIERGDFAKCLRALIEVLGI